MSEQQFMTQDIPTAEEFVEHLRPTHPDWGNTNSWSSDWIFRGQSNSKLTLTPSAWRRAGKGQEQTEAEKLVEQRKSELKPSLEAIIKHEVYDRRSRSFVQPHVPHDLEFTRILEVLLQAYTEFILVREFIALADSLAFHTPGASEFPVDPEGFAKEYHLNLYTNSRDSANFYSRVWRNPAVALAQHHGIPTRLLDWTRKPLYAAFFAAEKASQSQNYSDLIAVYAMHRFSLQGEVGLLTVPRSENVYLHAQDGVFTTDTQGDKMFITTGEWRHLEKANELYKVMPSMHPKKLTLPVSQIGELLRLLSLENISRAHLMPSFDNIAQALKTKWQWTSSSRL